MGQQQRKGQVRRDQWKSATVTAIAASLFTFANFTESELLFHYTNPIGRWDVERGEQEQMFDDAFVSDKYNKHNCNIWSKQNMEQCHFKPRGWWSRTELLGPAVAIFYSGIPQVSWWRCTNRRQPEIQCRFSIWTRTKSKTTKYVALLFES